MLAYFDTSALVPLVVDEPASDLCRAQWDHADAIVTSSLAYVETHSALARASRHGRLTPVAHGQAVDAFQLRWSDAIHVSPSDSLVKAAAALSARLGLRGYDAVHCATALAVASDDFVAISRDRELLDAWQQLGIATIDTRG